MNKLTGGMMPLRDLLDAQDIMKERYPKNPCPICQSNQIQLCADYNNPSKDIYKCRECQTTGHRVIWNMPRKPLPPTDSVLKLICVDMDLPLRLDDDGKYFIVSGKKVG